MGIFWATEVHDFGKGVPNIDRKQNQELQASWCLLAQMLDNSVDSTISGYYLAYHDKRDYNVAGKNARLKFSSKKMLSETLKLPLATTNVLRWIWMKKVENSLIDRCKFYLTTLLASSKLALSS